jgi:hypothetical protein
VTDIFKMQTEFHGYVMSIVGRFDCLCIAVLLTHRIIALAYSVWHHKTSHARHNIIQTLELGLNLERLGLTGEDRLLITSVGVRAWVPIKQVD